MEKQREVTTKFVLTTKSSKRSKILSCVFLKNCIRNTRKTDVPREIYNYVLFGENIKRNNGFLPVILPRFVCGRKEKEKSDRTCNRVVRISQPSLVEFTMCGKKLGIYSLGNSQTLNE